MSIVEAGKTTMPNLSWGGWPRNVIHVAAILALSLVWVRQPQTAGAQSAAPGGISSGLTLWLKADAGVETAANGTSITAWRDQSANHFDVTQSDATITAGRIPNTVNGVYPVLRFNGHNYLARTPGLGLTGAPAVTAFFYANGTKTGDARLVQFGSAAGTNLKVYSFSSDASIRFNNGNVVWVNNPLTGGFHLGTFRRATGATNVGADVFYRDGVLAAQSGSSNPNSTLSIDDGELLVGAGRNNSSAIASIYQGDIAEIIIYNRELSDTERSAVETYLTNKYTLAPEIQASKTALDFGTANVEFQKTTSSTVTITNTGELPLSFMAQGSETHPGLVLSGSSLYKIKSVSPDTTAQLAAGATLNVTLEFTGTLADYIAGGNNVKAGTLSIHTNAINTAKVDIALSGTTVPVELSTFSAE